MKKFQFRLNTVMDVYKLHQDQAEVALQERMMADQLARERLQGCQKALQDSDELLTSEHQRVQCAAQLLQHRRYLDRLNADVLARKEECVKAQEEVLQAKAVLIEASKRTKTIENLKTKQYQQYCQNILREEQAAMDEIALRKKSHG